ncbi:GntR family transcriptional regulator, transcriptional repressor for pyruvate dehydrogenase complex [Dethiosulfatibacter aminovorans DSM 17477]|uniref:GntR family transcriptional regulator, transcriptional repressor for pyruvate dehydrogenase complex n=1 Tax=Dethiosulfatibacter aminovorans DSM 17477 TaxID=1121476 RepID=A0A1M6BSF1_9FIRM|nr:FadR/GntR family transcriptional regulator [Dethiosulfatibacter aminovorans]SHI51626.1 GntR family transcriptional regulator, transcriptional repressor for pyruvate dehydrogenase complex [Dethiosulfatibacter aminovorans DSM 17477]
MNNSKDKQAYEHVIEYIGQQVEEGRLKKGDKIPTERKLVEILEIGRNSIREALEILDMLGIVERRQGSGTYIRKDFDSWFSGPMSIAFMLSDTGKHEIFEFRNMIEVEMATIAAERITDDEIEELKDCYEKLINIDDEFINAKYDNKFHSLLARATKNIILINSYNAMEYMMDMLIYDVRTRGILSEGKDLLVRIHREVCEAVVERNPVEAREAMKRHMTEVRKYFE